MAALLFVVAAVVVGLAIAACIDLTGLIPRPRGKDPWWRNTVIGQHLVWRLAAAGAVVSVAVPILAIAVLTATLLTVSQSGSLPNARPAVGGAITTLYDMNGQPIATFQQFTTYIPVTSSQIPAVVKKAVVASEDKRFYSHSGVDTHAIARALWADISGGQIVQGGSTIDQQYVRLLYGSSAKTISRKVREAILAGRVDAELTKDQILTGYLDRVYFGGGAYGIGAAAELYFHVPVEQLTLSDAATLAGILPAPTDYDPRVDPEGADTRRLTVLDEMRQQGQITQAQETAAVNQHLVVYRADDPPPADSTVVYPLPTGNTQYPWFVDYVERYLIDRYGVDAVLQGGLKVETSLDPTLQNEADATVAKSLQGTPDQVGMAMVVEDPQTGYVKAVVGGRDYATSQVNVALDNCPKQPAQGASLPICIDGGGSGRQPGSSFKPFTLATAFEQGISPNAVFDGPESYTYPPGTCAGSNCTVKNVESGGFGAITLRQATADSVNTVFAQLILKVGVAKVAAMAHSLGLTMINANGRDNSGAPYGPSLTLGSADVSPLDMAAAYGVFADQGLQLPATPVIKVVKPDGTVLEDNSSRAGKQVLTPQIANEVNNVLEGVVQNGTGTAANIGRPDGTAGKTGTTSSFSDAWFVGYTPQLVTSVWMGYTNGRLPLDNINGVPMVYGGTIPAETWHNFMSEALKGQPVENFVPPNAPTCSNPYATTTSSTVPATSTSSTLKEPFTVPATTTTSTTTTTVPGYDTFPAAENPTTTASTTTTLPPCPTTTETFPTFVFPSTSYAFPTSSTTFPDFGTTSTTLYPGFGTTTFPSVSTPDTSFGTTGTSVP